jgi:hypothetical protein
LPRSHPSALFGYALSGFTVPPKLAGFVGSSAHGVTRGRTVRLLSARTAPEPSVHSDALFIGHAVPAFYGPSHEVLPKETPHRGVQLTPRRLSSCSTRRIAAPIGMQHLGFLSGTTLLGCNEPRLSRNPQVSHDTQITSLVGPVRRCIDRTEVKSISRPHWHRDIASGIVRTEGFSPADPVT